MTDDLERRYLDGLATECATIAPLGGAPIPLEGVFVMLQALRSERPSPLQERPDVAPDAERRAHTGLREREPERDASRPEREPPPPAPPPPPVPLAQALRENLHLALLGEPGAGKSTALQYIALCFARPGMAADKLDLREPRIPVRVTLRDVATRLGTAQLWLVGAPAVAQLAGISTEQAMTLLDEWRNDGRLLLLLDGLDEVPTDCRDAAITAIRRFAATEEGRRSRIVVSSRLAGYQDLGAPFREFMLRPFADPAAARPFIIGWLAALRGKPTAEVETEAQQLVEQFTGQPGLARLLDNPLLLQLALAHYYDTDKLERNRAELYRRYIEKTAWEWAEQRLRPAKLPFEKAAVLEGLERVAWALHTRTDCTRDDLEQLLADKMPKMSDAGALLDFLRQPLGLLVAYQLDGAERLAFGHLTFQEYLVAAHLARAWKANWRRTWRFLKPRLHAAAWREPLLLLATALGEEAVTLVRHVKRGRSRYERLVHRDELLAAALAQETGPINHLPENSADDITDARSATTEVLGKLGAPHTVGPLIRSLASADSDVRREAAMALGRLGTVAVEPLINRLADSDPGVRQVAATALGSLGESRAVEPLVARLVDEELAVRWATAQALGKLGNPRAVEPLIARLVDPNWVVVEATVEALGELGDPRAAEPLVGRLADSHPWVREAAARALANLRDWRATEPLVALLAEDNSCVRRNAVWELGRIGDPRAVEPLLRTLHDEDFRVRREAGRALGKLGDPKSVGPLIGLLADSEPDVRTAAVEALGNLGSVAGVELVMRLKDSDPNMRLAATSALGRLSDPHAVEPLIEHLQDSDLSVRVAATSALGRLGDPRAVEPLIRHLEDSDPNVRIAVTSALDRLGDPRAAGPLIGRLADSDGSVRLMAAAALGRLGDPRAVGPLIGLMTDPELYMVRAAAGALERMGTVAAVPLIGCLMASEREVRQFASEALVGLAPRLNAEEVRLSLHALAWAMIRTSEWLYHEPGNLELALAARFTELRVAALPPTDPLDAPKRPAWLLLVLALLILLALFAANVLTNVVATLIRSPEGPVRIAVFVVCTFVLFALATLLWRWLDRHL